MENLSNKVGRYFRQCGFAKGDTISLMMETRLEYASMWLGLSKIGAITALINYNQRKETLVHSINVASSKAIIVSSELLDAIKEIVSDEKISKMKIYVYDNQNDKVELINNNCVDLHRELESISEDAFDISEISAKDRLFYIYTSGTTGMH
jgi:solute carrier family 27 fatty acid transporter 1/4